MRFAFPGSPDGDRIVIKDLFAFVPVELVPQLRSGGYILESIEPGVVRALAVLASEKGGVPVGQDYSDKRHYVTASREPPLEIKGITEAELSEKIPTLEEAARLATAAEAVSATPAATGTKK